MAFETMEATVQSQICTGEQALKCKHHFQSAMARLVHREVHEATHDWDAATFADADGGAEGSGAADAMVQIVIRAAGAKLADPGGHGCGPVDRIDVDRHRNYEKGMKIVD